MIPMVGFVQSYNVSVSAAITLWDIVSKRKEIPLTTKEHTLLLKSFIERATK